MRPQRQRKNLALAWDALDALTVARHRLGLLIDRADASLHRRADRHFRARPHRS